MTRTLLQPLHLLLAGMLAVLASALAANSQEGEQLKVGVTLHPYYSFVANVVGDAAEVVPLIDAAANPHGYQPQPGDIVRAQNLDVLVVNGVGHDEWAFEIVEAAGRSKDLPLIQANASVAMIPIAGDRGDGRIINPHTFISTTTAVQQVYEIARRLGEIDPENVALYRANARDYGARIRRLRADFMEAFAKLDTSRFRAATVHAGYDYLFQEFGLEIAAVIEPRHGVNPTARQMAATIEDIKAAGVNVLFGEQYFEGKLAETIRNETGVKVYVLSHINAGPYTPEKFEEEMRRNIETVLTAIRETTEGAN